MKVLKNIFLNSEQHRLRTGWRFLIELIPFLAIAKGRDVLSGLTHSQPLLLTISYLAYLAAGLVLAWLMARFLDRRSFSDYGFHLDRKWWMDLIFGLMLGALLMTGVYLTMSSAGWVTITGTAVTNLNVPFILAFLMRVVFFSGAALNEELTFRGYHMKNLSEGFTGKRIGPRTAIVSAFLVSSALFGLAHLANPNVTIFSTVGIILGGLLLCLPYLLTGNLAISIGLHLTWNLFQGTVYGFGVSGTSPGTRLFTVHQSGPDLFTGGSFGPEASLIGLIWMVIGCALIMLWIKLLHGKIKLYTPLAEYHPKYKKNMLPDEMNKPVNDYIKIDILK